MIYGIVNSRGYNVYSVRYFVLKKSKMKVLISFFIVKPFCITLYLLIAYYGNLWLLVVIRIVHVSSLSFIYKILLD